MKTWKLISMLLLVCLVGACDDDPAVEEGNGGDAGTIPSAQVSAFFGYESKTVLKNSGQVLVPVKLDRLAGKAVKVTVAVQQSDDGTIAREGVDFEVPEKVVTIPVGDTIAFLPVHLLDNEKVETDRVVVLNISGVYEGTIATAKTCSLHIVNNAFVEFLYQNRETYEAAGTYKVPVLITGELTETTTFTVRVKEGGTALEGTHFTLPQTQFTLEKGATSIEVGIKLVDDTEANADRWFDLELVEVKGSNAVIGKSAPVCRVTIISEEVLKSVAVGAAEYSVEEGGDLHIPVFLDKAPASGEADVEVTFSVKVANSTAIEGEDFTIAEKTIRFVPGQKEDEIVIKTTDNDQVNVDKIIDLSIKAAVGANMGTPDACQVTIVNNDFPTFEQPAYTVVEDHGELVLPVKLPAVQRADMRLKISVMAGEGTRAGEHFTLTSEEVMIPAGEVSGDVHIHIGHALEWTKTPAFTVYVAGTEGITWDESVCATVVSLTESDYRKLLGSWTLTCEPDNCAATCDVIVSGGDTEADRKANWGKQVNCVAQKFMWSQHDVTFTLKYDRGQLKIVLGQRCNASNWNYGEGKTNVAIRYIIDGNLTATEAPFSYDPEAMTIDWGTPRFGGAGYQNNTGDVVLYSFFQKKTKMVKK